MLRKMIRKQQKMLSFINKWYKTILLSCVFALILNYSAAAAHRMLMQQGIAEEVIRFHVLANSDDETDQQVKLKVRDAVLLWIEESWDWGQTEAGREKAKKYISSHLDEIEAVADEVLKDVGVSYRASASVEQCYFPDRTYGDCTFPAGWYEALRIRLGEAKGHNWWCVLYPDLCYSDCLKAVSEEGKKEKLKEVLSVQEYEYLLDHPKKWRISFRWFDIG